MLGLPKGKVFLVPWTEQWEREFLLEKQTIQSVLGECPLAIHHIGSTAVKDLSAKPIIDIAIEVMKFEDGVRCVPALEKIGYSYKGTSILPERHYFSKGEPRTHQIHLFQTGSEHLKKQLALKEYLNQNASDRKAYQELKEKLSVTYGADKLAYADAKSDFIHSLMQKLGFEN
ncbi:GrpB family protein [Paenibacillus periandrae]|uniref:GrpB family protein n=1 Tax=Paenibacillus periandrae TaxID=1761741 RepID=UPI001F0A005C|nr:GrpB family protein [Paenibacillus periandrae]